jgi:hypothetical protein
VKPNRPNPRLAKIHRNYTVEEIAKLFGIHKNTVRRWIKDGLPLVDSQRPSLVLGRDLAAYLNNKRASGKQSCQAGQMYCLKCRAPRYPAGHMADYMPITEKLGNLIGICPDCNLLMNRRVSLINNPGVLAMLDVNFIKAAL